MTAEDELRIKHMNDQQEFQRIMRVGHLPLNTWPVYKQECWEDLVHFQKTEALRLLRQMQDQPEQRSAERHAPILELTVLPIKPRVKMSKKSKGSDLVAPVQQDPVRFKAEKEDITITALRTTRSVGPSLSPPLSPLPIPAVSLAAPITAGQIPNTPGDQSSARIIKRGGFIPLRSSFCVDVLAVQNETQQHSCDG